MADENPSALIRRHEQLNRWNESDTNKCSDSVKVKSVKVKFQDGCVFLAACSSGDREEVKRLLERGADINTANVDGLTALHQACIDDNLDMVEFLVQYGADVDVCDNEGWTPLHATASCGFTEIARYLLRNNANISAVNNDGDLPYDICEDDSMEKLLQEAMDEQGVDADAARREEEERMMADANHWLSSRIVKEKKHPKTGATALHVAAAKGYGKVMTVLLQANVDINAKDNDGWTPLHAASHWGQEEACKILAENMCDMEAKNLVGQTAFDVADTEIIKLLEELKLKQASLKDQQKDLQKDIIQTKLPSRRRSSVTRMSVEQKHNVMKTVGDQERMSLDVKTPVVETEEKGHSSSSSASEDDSSESETEKKNEINKKTSEQNQPWDRDKPPIMATVEIKENKPEMPIIEEGNEKEVPDRENYKNIVVNTDHELTNDIGVGLKEKDKLSINDKTEIRKEEEEQKEIIIEKNKEDDEKIEKEKEEKRKLIENETNKVKNITKPMDKIKDLLIEDMKEKEILKEDNREKAKDRNKGKDKEAIENIPPEKDENIPPKEENIPPKKDENVPPKKDENIPPKKDENVPSKKERSAVQRTSSAPVATTEIPKITINSKLRADGDKADNETPSWRSGLRKTGSTSMVHDSVKVNEDDKNLPRSASSPKLAEENKKNDEKNDNKPLKRHPFLGSSSFSTADHNNSSISERYGGSTSQSQGLSNSYHYPSSTNSTSSYQSAYIPYYRRQQLENERKERERLDKDKPPATTTSSSRVSAPSVLAVTTATVTTTSTTASSTTITTPTSSFVHFRKSYEPPKRDEETETQRKVRAKRARETRRSTQGVTLDEIKQATEELKKTDPNAPAPAAATTSVSDRSAPSSDRQADEKRASDLSERLRDSGSVKERTSIGGDSAISRTHSGRDNRDEVDTSVSAWRRSRDERDESNKKDDEGRSSFRRSRAEKDLSSSAPSSSFTDSSLAYIPRSQRTDRTDRTERNTLSVADVANPSLNGSNLTRSTSLRSDRIRPEVENSRVDIRRDREHREKDRDKDKADTEKGENSEKRPESAGMRSRRMRRERRSTGIASYNAENEEEEKNKENKEESKQESTEKTEKTEKTESEDKSSGSRFNRYGSASDVPTHLSDRHSRPVSYDFSRSAPSLDKDYKKLYEEERAEKERLKRDLEQCKKELKEAKTELDRAMKRHEASRMSDTNDKREKRALERKLSEMEEELKKMEQIKEDNRRLREENGALIRVISKLSK